MINWLEGFLPYELAFQAVFLLAALLSWKIPVVKKGLHYPFARQLLVRFFTVWMAYGTRAYTESTYFWFVLFFVGFFNWAIVIAVCFPKQMRWENVRASVLTLCWLPLSMNLAVYNREMTQHAFLHDVFGPKHPEQNVHVFVACFLLSIAYWYSFMRPFASEVKKAKDASAPENLSAELLAKDKKIQELEAKIASDYLRYENLKSISLKLIEGARLHLQTDEKGLLEAKAAILQLANETHETISLQDAQEGVLREPL